MNLSGARKNPHQPSDHSSPNAFSSTAFVLTIGVCAGEATVEPNAGAAPPKPPMAGAEAVANAFEPNRF